MFPIGGYCKFKGGSDIGGNDYKEAWELSKKGEKPPKGSFLGASPQARILTCFAGPFFNFIFAILLLSIIWGIGFEIPAVENKIVLRSEIEQIIYPADEAGLKTGDRIIEINQKEVSYFHEIREILATNPNKDFSILVDRDGIIQNVFLTTTLDKSTGAGIIGISHWVYPVIGTIKEGSLAQQKGLLPGDKLISANGFPLKNTIDLEKIINQKPDYIDFEYERNGELNLVHLPKYENEDENKIEYDWGFSWLYTTYHTPDYNLFTAIGKGAQECWNFLVMTIKSLRLLFMGIDLTQAVSGPVRITYMMGDIATQSMGYGGFGTALRAFMNFIALISISLCIMNLLPLPIIDGGMILLYFVELIRKKPAHPKAISVFQGFGIFLIICLMVFAIFGDILYLIRGIK